MIIKGYRVTKDGKLKKSAPRQSVSAKIAGKKKTRVASRGKAALAEAVKGGIKSNE